jgi:hypothetical protein
MQGIQIVGELEMAANERQSAPACCVSIQRFGFAFARNRASYPETCPGLASVITAQDVVRPSLKPGQMETEAWPSFPGDLMRLE